jgi:uncharacterized membrane protein
MTKDLKAGEKVDMLRRYHLKQRSEVLATGRAIGAAFDTVVTAREENRLLAWRTTDGSMIQHAGRVRFQRNEDGSTTIDIRMTYNPVAGAVGHAVAWLIGADPKHQMDDGLLRMKTFLETGKLPRDAAEHGIGIEKVLPEQEEGSGFEQEGGGTSEGA